MGDSVNLDSDTQILSRSSFRLNYRAPLVDFILLAEFDIDTGSTLRHQFPRPIPNVPPDWFAENMLPEGAHNRELDYTYMFLNRNSPIEGNWHFANEFRQSDPRISNESSDSKFLFGINLVKTKHDDSVRRGAIVKAIAVFSQYSFIEEFKPLLDATLEKYFVFRSETVLRELFDSLCSIDPSILPSPSPLDRALMTRGVAHSPVGKPIPEHCPSSWTFPISIEFPSLPPDSPPTSYSLSIPLHRSSDEVGPLSLSRLVKVFGEGTMRIFHALLTRQRVLFVGYGHPAGEVAGMVLSALSMVSGPLHGLVRRTFPYANLADLSFLEVPGFIAGVTNPMFQQRDGWWDLLCVLSSSPITAGREGGVVGSGAEDSLADRSLSLIGMGGSGPSGLGVVTSMGLLTGTVISAAEKRAEDANSPSSKQPLSPLPSEAVDESHQKEDSRFLQSVLSGILAGLPEDWVKQCFFDHCSQVLLQAQDSHKLLSSSRLSEKTKKGFDANLSRSRVLAEGDDFLNAPPHPWAWSTGANPASPSLSSPSLTSRPSISSDTISVSDFDGNLLKSHVRKLQSESGLHDFLEVLAIFSDLDCFLSSEEGLQGLLSLLPESSGGLSVIAAGLFHSSAAVRLHAVKLLQKLESFPSTRPSVQALNRLFLSAYRIQESRMKSGQLMTDASDSEASLQAAASALYTAQQASLGKKYSSSPRSPSSTPTLSSPRPRTSQPVSLSPAPSLSPSESPSL